LNSIESAKGSCYCVDSVDKVVSLACGHQAILEVLEGEMRRIAESTKRRKRAA